MVVVTCFLAGCINTIISMINGYRLSSVEFNCNVRPCCEVGAGGVGSARGAALRWAAAVAASLGADGLKKLPPSVATALLLPAVICADAAVKGIAEEHRELATEVRSRHVHPCSDRTSRHFSHYQIVPPATSSIFRLNVLPCNPYSDRTEHRWTR